MYVLLLYRGGTELLIDIRKACNRKHLFIVRSTDLIHKLPSIFSNHLFKAVTPSDMLKKISNI